MEPAMVPRREPTYYIRVFINDMGASWDWGGINKATCDDIVRKIRKGKGEILLYDPVKKQ